MTVFGTVGLVVRSVSFPPGFIAMSRGYVGALVIFIFMAARGRLPNLLAIKKNFVPLFLSGAFIGINWILLFESYSYVGVSTATLCYYMAPVFVIIASPIFLSEKPGAVKIVAALVAFVGMALVSEPWSDSFGGKGMIGVSLALGAALFYASVTVTNKKMKDISSLDITLVQLLVAAVVVTPYSLIAEKITPEMFEPSSVLLLLAMGLVHTGVAYLLFFSAIKELPAAQCAIFGYVDPIVALILSAVVLGEKMSVFGIVGAVLILAATFSSEVIPALSERTQPDE